MSVQAGRVERWDDTTVWIQAEELASVERVIMVHDTDVWAIDRIIPAGGVSVGTVRPGTRDDWVDFMHFTADEWTAAVEFVAEHR